MISNYEIWTQLGFTEGEFHLLLNSMNGMAVAIQDMTDDSDCYLPEYLTGWEDDKDYLCKKWQVDAGQLRDKLQRLPDCHAFYLVGWVNGYWHRVSEDVSSTPTGNNEGLTTTVASE